MPLFEAKPQQPNLIEAWQFNGSLSDVPAFLAAIPYTHGNTKAIKIDCNNLIRTAYAGDWVVQDLYTRQITIMSDQELTSKFDKTQDRFIHLRS